MGVGLIHGPIIVPRRDKLVKINRRRERKHSRSGKQREETELETGTAGQGLSLSKVEESGSEIGSWKLKSLCCVVAMSNSCGGWK